MIKLTKKNFIKIVTNKKILLTYFIFLIVTIIYFVFPITVYPDSALYYSYLRVFNGIDPIASWSLLRGPSLPLVLFIFTSTLGYILGTMIGILAGTYILFVGLLTIFYTTLLKIIKSLKLNKQMRTFAIILFLIIIVFNPILFGYFHALLTEFVALFIALISCVLAWKWIKVDFVSHKIKYILYSIFFAFIFVFMWFLKQPYLTVAVFPLFIAVVISIIKNHKINNIIQRILTLGFCVCMLIISISGWRSFLISNGADNQGVNGIDDNFLSGGIIKGITDTRLAKDFITGQKFTGDKFISSEEEFKINQVLEKQSAGGKDRVRLLTVMSSSGEVIDKIPVIQASEVFSVKEAALTLAELSIKHPLVVASSYFANYLSSIDVYNFNANPQTGALTPIKKLGVYGHENHTIGILYLYYPANMDILTFKQLNYPGLQYIVNNPNIIQKVTAKVYYPMHQAGFMLLFLLLPFMLIFTIIRYRKLLKFKKKDEIKIHIHEFVLVLLGFGFLHIMFNVVLGAIIDRYIYVAFPEVAFGFILLLIMDQRVENIVNKINLKIAKFKLNKKSKKRKLKN